VKRQFRGGGEGEETKRGELGHQKVGASVAKSTSSSGTVGRGPGTGGVIKRRGV